MICKIADFIIEFKNPSKAFEAMLKDYLSLEKPDFSVSVSTEEIAHARTLTEVKLSDLQAEASAFYTKLISLLPHNEALFFHASLIDVEGVGIAFTALSGTGKSTHTFLWQRLLGKKVEIINGDKPIIRFIDGVPYGYGNPWRGKEHLGKNARTPLKHLCFIERSECNRCSKISSADALQKIFSQIFIPKNPQAAQDTLLLLDLLLKNCTVWRIECNTDISAAQTAYNAIFKEKPNET